MNGFTDHALGQLRWRPLRPDDLAEMHALHLRSIAGLPPALVKPESRAFLQGLLEGRGRVDGAFHHEALVAYGVLQHDLLPADDPRPVLGLAPGRPVRKLAGAAVDPAWRGQGLQRMLIQRRMARAEGAVLFATAAPGNIASWRSLTACGFAVRALQYRYGGHARYLLAYVPGECWVPGDGLAQEWPLDTIPAQEQLLAQGWRGVSPGRVPGSLRLVRQAGGGAA